MSRLIKTGDKTWLGFYQDENLTRWILDIPPNSIIFYLRQSENEIHQVIYQDQVGWIQVYDPCYLTKDLFNVTIPVGDVD